MPVVGCTERLSLSPATFFVTSACASLNPRGTVGPGGGGSSTYGERAKRGDVGLARMRGHTQTWSTWTQHGQELFQSNAHWGKGRSSGGMKVKASLAPSASSSSSHVASATHPPKVLLAGTEVLAIIAHIFSSFGAPTTLAACLDVFTRHPTQKYAI